MKCKMDFASGGGSVDKPLEEHTTTVSASTTSKANITVDGNVKYVVAYGIYSSNRMVICGVPNEKSLYFYASSTFDDTQIYIEQTGNTLTIKGGGSSLTSLTVKYYT